MSSIDLSNVETAVWLMIAAAVLVGGAFLWFAWRTLSRRRRGHGGKS